MFLGLCRLDLASLSPVRARGGLPGRVAKPKRPGREAPPGAAVRRVSGALLAGVETQILTSTWRNPDVGRISFGNYIAEWIAQRPNLRPRTIDLYRWLYRRYLEPKLQDVALGDITPGLVRAWRADLITEGITATMVAKAYRLLRAVLNTAVDDELIRRNPCRIKGAGTERAAERPTATVAQVFDLAGRVPARYRALILLAAFTSLRHGELIALRRQDFDSRRGTLTVRTTLVELQDGRLLFGPPKTEAGMRTVTVPTAIRPDVRKHLKDFTGEAPDALIFTGVTGAVLRRSNFQRTADWTVAVAAAGLPGFHFHDLRHTGSAIGHVTGTPGNGSDRHR
ncbi:site-specific integrase [Dactylosporangium sp. CA-139114]|uniref:site-specific integrase n=1 Tax=Dactylosporangium sp. CA-139114 TaxID=3239931 RepID=UPI003D97BD0E